MNFLQSRLVQVLGAGGVGYYGREYLPKEWLEKQMDMLGGLPGGGMSGSNEHRELAKVLSNLGSKIEGLASSASQRQAAQPPAPQTIVVRESGSRGWSVSGVAIVACTAGVVYAYLRFWKGLRYEDLQLATQGSLRDATAKFGASMEAMRGAVDRVRASLSDRIHKLKETIQRVREDLGKVHDDVRDVKADVDATRSLAESCDRRLEDVDRKQDFANNGIQALCAVVGDLLRNAANTPAIENLRAFTRRGLPGGGGELSQPPELVASSSSRPDDLPPVPQLADIEAFGITDTSSQPLNHAIV